MDMPEYMYGIPCLFMCYIRVGSDPRNQQLQDASSGFLEQNPDPLEEKQVLFTVQQSFPHPLFYTFVRGLECSGTLYITR